MTASDFPEQRGPQDGGGHSPSSPDDDGGTPASPDVSSPSAPSPEVPAPDAPRDETAALLAERVEDLQRLQAEYVNYRKRVDRDRLVARDLTVVAFIEAFLPVLDDIDSARKHGELAEGSPFAAIAEKFEGVLTKFGWERYGAKGEVFDPNVHEALMHSHSAEVSEPTVSEVLQSGHRAGDRIVRAARVVVIDPEA